MSVSEPRRKETAHVVARADEIGPGQRRVVEVGGRSIGVFNVGGTFHALRNVCPHRTGPLCLGRVRPLVVADGFGYAHEREGEILKCPWHQWEFDIKTGRSVVDPNVRVRAYRVEKEGENLVLYA